MAPGKRIPEPVLIDLLRNKEKSSLSYLYDHYSGALYGVILRIVQKESVAEEVLQDVFIKIWNKIDGYDETKGRLFTWMVNVARNQAIDKTRSKEIRREQKTGALENLVNRIDSKDFLEQSTDGIGVKELLNKLQPEQQFVVDYLYLKGYTQSELAEEFNIPLGTIKTRVRLAMEQLRTMLGIS